MATFTVLMFLFLPAVMLVMAKSSCSETVTTAVSVMVIDRGYVVNSSRLFLHSLVGASIRMSVYFCETSVLEPSSSSRAAVSASLSIWRACWTVSISSVVGFTRLIQTSSLMESVLHGFPSFIS